MQSGINSASLQDYGKKNQRINRIQIELFGIILTQHCCPPTGTGIVNSAWRNKLQCYRSANIYHHMQKIIRTEIPHVGHGEGELQ